MPNMAIIIASHNKNLLGNKQKPKTTIPPCNWRQNSQKRFGMRKILAMNLQTNGLLLIEPLLTNPGLDPAIYA